MLLVYTGINTHTCVLTNPMLAKNFIDHTHTYIFRVTYAEKPTKSGAHIATSTWAHIEALLLFLTCMNTGIHEYLHTDTLTHKNTHTYIYVQRSCI